MNCVRYALLIMHTILFTRRVINLSMVQNTHGSCFMDNRILQVRVEALHSLYEDMAQGNFDAHRWIKTCNSEIRAYT